MHHYNGDFKYFREVNKAAVYIGQFCRRWGRIQVTDMKEKFGTARVYCSFGIYSLHSLTHPGWVFSQYPKWLWKFDCHVMWKILEFIHINTIIYPYQKFIYRLAYKRAMKKWPMIKKEIKYGSNYPHLLQNLCTKD